VPRNGYNPYSEKILQKLSTDVKNIPENSHFRASLRITEALNSDSAVNSVATSFIIYGQAALLQIF